MSRLTKREKELLCDLISIAQAGEGPGVGDFQEWTEEDFQKLESAGDKLTPSPKKSCAL